MCTEVVKILERESLALESSLGTAYVACMTECPHGGTTSWCIHWTLKRGYQKIADLLWNDTPVNQFPDMVQAYLNKRLNPAPKKPKLASAYARNTKEAQKLLALWNRKRKLATTKVKMYEKRVKYCQDQEAKHAELKESLGVLPLCRVEHKSNGKTLWWVDGLAGLYLQSPKSGATHKAIRPTTGYASIIHLRQASKEEIDQIVFHASIMEG